MTITYHYNLAHLHIKSCFLEILDQWQAASDGVWLALSKHLLCGFIKFLESRRVQVACYTLCVCVCVYVWRGTLHTRAHNPQPHNVHC